jgi:hypothetical protein
MNYVTGFEQLVKEYRKPNIVVAEIGVYDGATTKYVAPIVKEENGKYIAVDWFKGNETIGAGQPGFSHGYDENQHDIVIDKFKQNLELVDCIDIVTIHDMPSLEAVNLIEDRSLDICFIDADHRYRAVKADILAYIPKIKNGGILSGHDLDQGVEAYFNTWNEEELEKDMARGGHAGVGQAVGEIIGFEKITKYPNTVWAVRINENREFEKI